MAARAMTKPRATPPDGYHIRAATVEDLRGVRACLLEAFEPYRPSYTAKAFTDTVPSGPALEDRRRRMSLLVAVDGAGKVLGTVASRAGPEGVGHLRGMAVRRDWQGTGVARAILDRALKDLRSRGCRRATLETTIPLARAARFYAKNGFRRSGRVSDFFGMPLIEYVRELDGVPNEGPRSSVPPRAPGAAGGLRRRTASSRELRRARRPAA